jgi:hypothetical protein
MKLYWKYRDEARCSNRAFYELTHSNLGDSCIDIYTNTENESDLVALPAMRTPNMYFYIVDELECIEKQHNKSYTLVDISQGVITVTFSERASEQTVIDIREIIYKKIDTWQKNTITFAAQHYVIEWKGAKSSTGEKGRYVVSTTRTFRWKYAETNNN